MGKSRGEIETHRPVVWVTGASKGIGRAIARAFASIGCHVCVSGRSPSLLKSVVREITTDGGIATAIECDISRPASIITAGKRIRDRVGEVDVVVNNAGVTVFKKFLATTMDEFDTIIATNLRGHIACIKTVLPSMIRRRNGWIINILSTASVYTFEGSAAYTATKAGLLALSKVLREEVRRSNVRVVNVLPGPTNTEMWSKESRRKFSSRMMSAKSVAEAVLAAYQMPDDVVVEEMLIRPIQGDID